VFDYRPLFRFLDYPINNVGDPFVPSNYHLNTHEFEREVVAAFERLTHAPPNATWGYVTNGGTEGNMYGLFLAREVFPDGIVYYSEDTHYSVNKILRFLHLRNIQIRSEQDGRIDLEDLHETLKVHRDVPALIFLTIGTTMKGAVDDLVGVKRILRDLAMDRHYIHADAALSGMILPFVEDPQPWDFRAGVDSIAISGHKMIGSPIPCGVALARRAHVERVTRSVEYIGSVDTTLAGSRNGLTPLFLWYAFQTVGLDGFARQVRQCLEVADYAVAQLTRAGQRAWRHRNSITVVLDRPAPAIVSKWQLAVHHGDAHIITMPHVTRTHIDRLIEDVLRNVPAAGGGTVS
jgi:histidine decarboxylase